VVEKHNGIQFASFAQEFNPNKAATSSIPIVETDLTAQPQSGLVIGKPTLNEVRKRMT